MANTAASVLAGKPLSTGGVLRAPLGTALPTTAIATPNASFHSQGYIGSDGVTETIGRSSTQIRAWGGDVVKVTQDEFGVTYKLTFIESLNAEVLASLHTAANVTAVVGTGGLDSTTAVLVNRLELTHYAWIFEIKDGVAKVRIVVPNGVITEIGDTVYSDSDAIGYEVTIQAIPDASGNNAYKYTDDGVPIP